MNTHRIAIDRKLKNFTLLFKQLTGLGPVPVSSANN